MIDFNVAPIGPPTEWRGPRKNGYLLRCPKCRSQVPRAWNPARAERFWVCDGSYEHDMNPKWRPHPSRPYESRPYVWVPHEPTIRIQVVRSQRAGRHVRRHVLVVKADG